MVADTKDLAFEKSKYFSKYSVHLIEKSNNFSTKKEHIVVLTSNEFRQLEIQNGEIPQSHFKMRGESKWQQQKYGKYKRD